MKIALCLYGVVGNKTTKAGSNSDSVEILKMGYDKYKKNLLSKYDTDVFLHTWSTDFEQEILNLYKPKNSIIEKQEIFDIPDHVKGDSFEQPKRRQNHYSRWRSTQKVLKLLSNSDEDYDFVLLSRFDLGLENPFLFENLSKEVLKIVGINGNDFSVIRGQEGTTDVDHFDGQKVSLYNGRYNFTGSCCKSNMINIQS